MNKKILLLGSYGQNNLGDEMMLELLVKKYKKVDPDLWVNSTDPSFTEKKYRVNAFSTSLTKDTLKKIKALVRSDVVIFGGGTIFIEHFNLQGRRNLRPIFLTFFITIFSKILGKKVCYFAIGIEAIESTLGKLLTYICLKLSDITIVRDRRSFNFSKKLGAKNLVLGTDMIFSISDFKKRIKKKKKNNLTVGVAPCYWVRDSFDEKEKFVRKLQEVVQLLLKDKSVAKVILIPFQVGHLKRDDLWLSNKIMKNLRKGRKLELITNYSHQEIYNQIKKLDLLIGVRLHSLILSLMAGVPILAIAHQPKILSLMKEFNLDFYCIDANKLSGSRIKKYKSKIVNNKDLDYKISEMVIKKRKLANNMFEKLNKFIYEK